MSEEKDTKDEYLLMVRWGIPFSDKSAIAFGICDFHKNDETWQLYRSKNPLPFGGGFINQEIAVAFRNLLNRFIANPAQHGYLKKDVVDE